MLISYCLHAGRRGQLPLREPRPPGARARPGRPWRTGPRTPRAAPRPPGPRPRLADDGLAEPAEVQQARGVRGEQRDAWRRVERAAACAFDLFEDIKDQPLTEEPSPLRLSQFAQLQTRLEQAWRPPPAPETGRGQRRAAQEDRGPRIPDEEEADRERRTFGRAGRCSSCRRATVLQVTRSSKRTGPWRRTRLSPFLCDGASKRGRVAVAKASARRRVSGVQLPEEPELERRSRARRS